MELRRPLTAGAQARVSLNQGSRRDDGEEGTALKDI